MRLPLISPSTWYVHVSRPRAHSQLIILMTQTNPILGISFCMMTIRLQLRGTNTVVGSGHSKQPYNFRTASKEHSSYASGSVGAPNELMVFSSKRTVDDSTFDVTASKV